MLEHLQEWLKIRAGAAPVWVTMVGDDQGDKHIMRAVDSLGVVLARPSSGGNGVAYPWTSVFSIFLDRSPSSGG